MDCLVCRGDDSKSLPYRIVGHAPPPPVYQKMPPRPPQHGTSNPGNMEWVIGQGGICRRNTIETTHDKKSDGALMIGFGSGGEWGSLFHI